MPRGQTRPQLARKDVECREPELEGPRPADVARAAARRTRPGCRRPQRVAELRAHDRAGRAAADDIAFTGEERVGGIDRAAGGAELAGEIAGRQQPFARPHLAGRDGAPDALIDLAKQRDAAARIEIKTPLSMRRGHGLFDLSNLGPVR
jgi:hypothetical protein